ncbi:hypothetical protein [Streptomyces sp. NPDC056682]|uniref:hypothetical protein n=1 Tax=Streptomyces sp. NPDC056682 TaxID=3345909 RepID=UPI003678A817
MPAIIEVHAKQGKRLRPEPIAQLYAQGLVRHLGEFPRLEGQLVTWIPGMDPPDRMDACVHSLTELADPAAAAVGTTVYADRRLSGCWLGQARQAVRRCRRYCYRLRWRARSGRAGPWPRNPCRSEPHHLRAAVAVVLKALHEAYSLEISVA